MIADRETYLRSLNFDSWRIGRIPAMRGRILDSQGSPLAWSVRYFSLYYDVAAERTKINDDIAEITKILTVSRHLDDMRSGRSILLKEEISPGEILKLRAYLKENHRFRISSNFRREYALKDPKILHIIGRTRIIEDKEVGISGFENTYNPRLIGTDGKYRVMVDSSSNWISATWEEIQPPVPGFDVYIPIEVE